MNTAVTATRVINTQIKDVQGKQFPLLVGIHLPRSSSVVKVESSIDRLGRKLRLAGASYVAMPRIL